MKASKLTCPFCGETDFDEIGLKMHFLNGWCEAWNNIEPPKRYEEAAFERLAKEREGA